ncbi:alpha/beta hydrolase [Amycolatopsis rubida]|uniref:Alpha/beta hydrolase n=1 Tax=Amycolatopsis rubida TaxID=112413 RepID=A0ABX0BT16_9PSEU|nr:alpha/beta hydrolase [Amycolatopsis sp. M39]MYW92431.1 alpha/beta fold hydrolase [Amycolatopsis rubida]NEC57419.1 alpha/beta hydrolase [Amycolatopsis rubida]OAP29014.1 Soluble epoxide hydrolase [Amycolatopsis sp. M39]
MAAGRLIAAGGSVLAAAGLAAGGWAARNRKMYDWALARTRRAGFTEHDVVVNGSKLHYAQGPAGDKPPLLLVHGQAVDWQSYARVLPDLARDFTVYAVDVHGHGQSARTPEKYTATAAGADLARFAEEVIGTRVVVSGHSSGGQLAAWLAGNRPDLVRAVVLEDPPLFTTLLPRAEKTWNWVDLASACHAYLESGETDWGAYLFAHQKLWDFFGDGADRIIRSGLKRREKHPDRPITVFFMPPSWNDMQRAIELYDPRFGDAFYTGAWDAGFDHEATLRKIEAPAILIHANWKYGGDGVLQGAIDAKDAQRIASLIHDVEVVRVDSGHNVHGEKPAQFTEIVRSVAIG